MSVPRIFNEAAKRYTLLYIHAKEHTTYIKSRGFLLLQ
jgi:hypothetical protein